MLLWARGASAQEIAAQGTLERFQPATAGDAMFGVPSPTIGGHLVLRPAAYVDYAHRPLSIEADGERATVVSHQLRLHLNASLSLWDTLLVSADVPFVLSQGGDSPVVEGVRAGSPSGATVGDPRLGARLRLVGGDRDGFQLGVGGYLFLPSRSAPTYASEGAVRAEPHLLVGGRFEHFVYSFSAGPTLRGSSRPTTLDVRAGAGVLFADQRVQIGPEVYVSSPLRKDVVLETQDFRVTTGSQTAAELLFGAKVRPVPSMVVGAGAGPGLSKGWGTPSFLAVGMVGYDPQPEPAAPRDADGDGIADGDDACPSEPGVRSDDPKKNGCPPDRDGDGILDRDDACPGEPGVRNDDPKKNGCPPVPTENDGDGDGILDKVDACPSEPGVKSDDPKKNGCPPPKDSDGDGIPDSEDVCPNEKGAKDPERNGCPRVQVLPREIRINRQIHFKFNKSTLDQTIDPVSDDLLEEVRNAIQQNPDIELIEVQGHADNVGPAIDNLSISAQRAAAVKMWLVARGIPAQKLVTRGYGYSAPVAPNSTEEGRQANRRVQFEILKRKSTSGR